MQHRSTNATGLKNLAPASGHSFIQRFVLVLLALQTAAWLPYANAQEGDPSQEHRRREREREERRERPPREDRPDRPNPPRENPRPRPEPPREEPRPRPEPPRENPRPRPEPPRPGPDRDRERREREERDRRERDRVDRERREREERDRWERDRWEREERARREREERDRWEREEQARREREERERREREERDREPSTIVLAYETHDFRYSKPHDTMTWDLQKTTGPLVADQLSISSNGTNGMKGKNGIAGISQAVVYYTDGTSIDLVAQAKRMGDPHYVAKTGQLRMISEFDVITLQLDSRKAAYAVFIKADSWIAANVPVELVFSLEQVNGVSLP